MTPGNSGKDRFYFATGHQLSFTNGFLNSGNGALNIYHYTLTQTLGLAGADPDDLKPFFRLVPNNAADFGGSNVEPDNQIIRFFVHDTPLASALGRLVRPLNTHNYFILNVQIDILKHVQL